MAKDKITIPAELLEATRTAAENANVKIMIETPIGNDVILTLRFRQPNNLFFMGRLYQSAINASEQLPINFPKPKKPKTKK